MSRLFGAMVAALFVLLVIGLADMASEPGFATKADCLAHALRPYSKAACERKWALAR